MLLQCVEIKKNIDQMGYIYIGKNKTSNQRWRYCRRKLNVGLKSLNWAAQEKKTLLFQLKPCYFHKYFKTLKVSLTMFLSTTKLKKMNNQCGHPRCDTCKNIVQTVEFTSNAFNTTFKIFFCDITCILKSSL